MAARSLASIVRSTAQPPPSSPIRPASGDEGAVEEDLVEVVAARHLAQRADVDAGLAHRQGEKQDTTPRRGRSGRSGRRAGRSRRCRLPTSTPSGPTRRQPPATGAASGGDAGEVGPGVGLGQQLAPALLAAHDPGRWASPQLVGAVGEQDRRQHLQGDGEHLGRHAVAGLLLGDDRVLPGGRRGASRSRAGGGRRGTSRQQLGDVVLPERRDPHVLAERRRAGGRRSSRGCGWRRRRGGGAGRGPRTRRSRRWPGAGRGSGRTPCGTRRRRRSR